jgi:nucleoside-diphosphate-sugar epimerase
MGYRIFVAGAIGAIGKPLTLLLVEAGHEVFGSTRSEAKAQQLRAAHVEPVVLDVFDLHAEGTRAVTVDAVATLEQLTMHSPPLAGIVLRYGQLYGPGTGRSEPAGSAPVHVDAAARAALLAIDHAQPGPFNIAEDTGVVSTAKARTELGWDPGFRLGNGRP